MEIKNLVILTVVLAVISIVAFLIIEDEKFQRKYTCEEGNSCVSICCPKELTCENNTIHKINDRIEANSLRKNFKQIIGWPCLKRGYEDFAGSWKFSEVKRKTFSQGMETLRNDN